MDCLAPLAMMLSLNSATADALRNPAWLQITASTASAEAFAEVARGSFASYNEADAACTLGGRAEAQRSVSPRVDLAGSVGYASFTGRNMGGSMLISPGDAAFDMVEMSDSTRGTKCSETYALQGTAAVKLSKRLGAGVHFGYRAANMAKQRDLRHTNVLSDMRIGTGLMLRMGAYAEAGAGYTFRRSVERIGFATYGNTDRQYTSLISYGAFYGRTELFGDDGYTDGKASNSLADTRHSASVQLRVAPSRRLTWHSEAAFEQRSGYYGRRSSSTPVYVAYGGAMLAASSTLTLMQGECVHRIAVSAEQRTLRNAANIFRVESTPGGLTEVVYFGRNSVLHRIRRRAHASYTAQLRTWQLQAAAQWGERRQTVVQYPYYRQQTVSAWQALVAAEREVALRRGAMRIAIGAGGGSGGGTMKRDGTYTQPSSGEAPPKEQAALLAREYEHLTASHAEGRLRARYALPVGGAMSVYLAVEGVLGYAWGLEQWRGVVGMGVGIRF